MALEQAWYRKSPWLRMLRPLSAVFTALAERRRNQYLKGVKPVWRAPVPVIVVGNISVGGTGKSPLVIWLVNWLREQGYKPGVVSRGYGAKPAAFPFSVTPTTLPSEGGDEPVMIARRTSVPLVIDPDRPAAARHLLQHFDCDIIISDDGMQHYALGRDIEIAVVDGQRGFANGRCLPEGPLREPVERLASVDLIVVNGKAVQFPGYSYSEMHLQPGCVHPVDVACDALPASLQNFAETSPEVHGVAAIGNPERFFSVLEKHGLTVKRHAFSDHHAYKMDDFSFAGGESIIMTEKDAVKCAHLPLKNAWYLPVDAQFDDAFSEQLTECLQALKYDK